MDFNEKFLYHIWDAQHLASKLETVSGKKIKIFYQGRYNTDSGPDFKNAVIQVGRRRIQGDIEIELKTYNWKNHAHNEDPHFDDVILHVVFEHNEKGDYTIKQNGTKAEILELQSQLDKDIAKLLSRYSVRPYEEQDKECELFQNLELKETKRILNLAGIERFENKVKRFKAEHFFADYDQLLYQGIMEALGYSKNKFQMLKFSTDQPYEVLKELYKDGLTREELIGNLLYRSGLINHLPASFPNEFKHKWIAKNLKVSANRYNWQLFRIRPTNHPVARLIQISEFLFDSLQTSIFHKILQLFSMGKTAFELSDFRKRLYSIFRKRSEILPQKSMIGKTRIDTILINIILPLVVVYAQEKNYKDLERTALQIYREYPSLAENYISKHMKTFLKEEQQKLIGQTEIFQQGILKLYYSHCREHLCSDCREVHQCGGK